MNRSTRLNLRASNLSRSEWQNIAGFPNEVFAKDAIRRAGQIKK